MFREFKIVIFNAVVFGAFVTSGLSNANEVETKLSGHDIAVMADLKRSGFEDFEVSMEMILFSRSGKKSERKLRMRSIEVEGDGDRSVLIFDTPKSQKGTALLTINHHALDDEQAIYLPALRRTKRIASKNKSGPFVGSEFAYEDINIREVDKYTYELLREETYNGMDCYVIKRIAKDVNSGYSYQIQWYDKAELRNYKIDFYDRKEALLKTLLMDEYRLYKERFWRVHKADMTNHQNAKKTRLVWSEYALGIGLKQTEFDLAALARAR